MGIPVMQMRFYVDEIAILDNGSPSALFHLTREMTNARKEWQL